MPTAEKLIVLNLEVCTCKVALLMQEKASCSSSDGSVGNCCRKHAMWRKRAKTKLPSVTHLSLQCGCNYGVFIVSTICTE